MRTEIRNSERELHQFQFRTGIAGGAVLIAFGLLAARFLYLQVIQHDVYQAKAEDNRISIVPVTPNRGLIVDRNGVVIARNYSGYTLEIFPAKVKNLEQTIDQLSELVDIQPRDKVRFRKLLAETRNAESLPIRSRLSDEEVARYLMREPPSTGVDHAAPPDTRWAEQASPTKAEAEGGGKEAGADLASRPAGTGVPRRGPASGRDAAGHPGGR